MSMIVNRRDLDFILFEMLQVEALLSSPRYAAYDRAAISSMLDAAQQIAEDRFLPVAATVDANEPKFVDGKALVPNETVEALRAYAEAGFFSLPFDEDVGGLQAPWFLHTAVGGIFTCANTAVTNYAFLTIAAANLLKTFGTDRLKDQFLPRMLEGQWFGTMCLSEPQAGSSLADIRTMATPVADGMYSIQGSKMWISGGDHDISQNIVHIVLAKVPGGPPGTKGISLFLVPKKRLDADGSPGVSNNIALAGLNHKMGQRGTTNCLLNFGEGGETLGYLIGEEHRGLEYMFHMMNEARLGVGYASTMSGLAGLLYSADYAKTRAQGRRIGERDPRSPQVPIIDHVDVRRMLMAQKAAVEGAQALCFYCATLIDTLAISTDAEERRWLGSLLGLLTPVVKSWPSEHCLEANKWAIQILGGYGYTRDYPVERLYRDNRLNHIHEGTFGIQGIDLVGRKISSDGGQTLSRFADMVRSDINTAKDTLIADEADRLSACVDQLLETTRALLACPDVELRTASATVFLDAFGHVVIGWMWIRQAVVAAAALKSSDLTEPDRQFYEAKLQACRYFHRYEIPLAQTRLEFCSSLDDTCLASTAATFG